MGAREEKEQAPPAPTGEPTWERLGIFLRDRGDDTYKRHTDVARECCISVDWLEERLRDESIQGFEVEDGAWVTTTRAVWKFLERDLPDSPREVVHSWEEVQRLAPEPFVVRPRVSRAGNCVFMYFAPDEAWADRVDDFLTVYHSFASSRIVGFKLKNLTLLTARLGDLWVEFHTAQFSVYMLIQRVLEASLKSPTFDHETLPKYREMLETARAITVPPIPALA